MIKVGIIGGAGYTGGKLIRILLGHQECSLTFVHSRSYSGKLLSDVHRDLIGETGMTFSANVSTDVDMLFLCMGHGESLKIAQMVYAGLINKNFCQLK